VLDFQDAVYGPISYDIASLMRDAFLTWDEDFVLDITIRYWEKARKAGLMDFEDWHSDFGAFYRAVEWMGLQRHLKVAGIFARLTLRDGKPKYLADAPRFIHYIRSTCDRYRELGPLLKLDRRDRRHHPHQWALLTGACEHAPLLLPHPPW
jgi:N-acetylmuramate 1-kinase